jgi:hypothetical protein
MPRRTVPSHTKVNRAPLTNGLRNPIAGLPAVRRASLRRDTSPAKVGDEAEVPPTDVAVPPTITWKPSPSAATSGVPRAAALYESAGGRVDGSTVDRYLGESVPKDPCVRIAHRASHHTSDATAVPTNNNCTTGVLTRLDHGDLLLDSRSLELAVGGEKRVEPTARAELVRCHLRVAHFLTHKAGGADRCHPRRRRRPR